MIRRSNTGSLLGHVRPQEISKVRKIHGKPDITLLCDRHISVLGELIKSKSTQSKFLWGSYSKRLYTASKTLPKILRGIIKIFSMGTSK